MESRFSSPADMREAVFVDHADARARVTRFWMLLILSSVIASAGVVADSAATVIGAMIVAPLLAPIQGTMLATVLGDRRNLLRSLLLLVAGSAVAVVIGALVGLLVVGDIVAATNSQVAGRVSPRLIDLLAALGTGVVGSIALVRRDIADTLPGVAIAISLVPPLTVVGLTLESGAYGEALGALLLFITNVVAIVATGIVVMSFYGVTKLAAVRSDGGGRAALRGPVVMLAVMLVLVGVPLAATSAGVASRSITEAAVHEEVDRWSAESGWVLDRIETRGTQLRVHLEGPLPVPETEDLRTALDERGVDLDAVVLVLVPVYEVPLGE